MGRALTWVYPVKLVAHVPELGSAASDQEIIRWCAANGHMLVTKDLLIASEPLVVTELKQAGSGVLWIRHREGNISNADVLYVLARDLRRVIEMIDASSAPLFLATGLLSRVRPIELRKVPTKRPGRPRR